MRIRSTRPEFWRSARIAAVSWEARLVLKGLESFVDDNGVGKDDLALIVGDLFQRDLVREPSRTLARVSEAIAELHQAGLVWRYAPGDTELLYVSFWESIQRIDKPQRGRFPRPDGTMDYKDSEIRECVASPREDSRALAPVTGEQGNRGTGDKDPWSPAPPSTDGLFADDSIAAQKKPEPGSDDDPDWVKFWSIYPLKKAKDAARRAWRGALKKKGATAAAIIAGAERYRDDPARKPDYTAYPATWLNAGRWTDDVSPQPSRQGHTPYQDPEDLSIYKEEM